LNATNSYPARFSADSQSIIVVSWALSYQKWAVRDGQRLDSKDLQVSDGCVDAQLSSDGEMLACYRPDLNLGVLQLSNGQWVFSEQIRTSDPHLTVIPIPLDVDGPFAGPFGFTLSHNMKPLANRAVSRLVMRFSPEGSVLVAGDEREGVRVDLPARKRTNLPGAIQKQLSGSIAIENSTRALVIPRDKPGEPTVRSLANGGVVATPNFKADSADLATDPRYALLYEWRGEGARVFDLEANRLVETPENIAVDVFGGEVALAVETGELFLCKPGEQRPFATVNLPLNGMPILRGASVAPSLDKLAIAVDGEGGLFEIATGKRISNTQEFSSLNFGELPTGFLLTRGRRWDAMSEPDYVIDRVDAQGAAHAAPKERRTDTGHPQTVLRLDTMTGRTSPIWTTGQHVLSAGGPVLFEYSFEGSSRGGISLPQGDDASLGAFPQPGALPYSGGVLLPQGVSVPFRLRALDPGTGKELWSRSFTGLPPIPFADPQGDRLVLSWKAKSPGAWSAAKGQAVTKDALRKAKLTDHDSFLEALDSRTGKSVGGVLVETGTGPLNFDSIFSTGQSIIFSRDAARVYVYSMLDGQLKGRLVGIRPAANARTNLLALETDSGQLGLYDLNTATKLDELSFPDAIVYTHFSEDGERLFVLTESQSAFVLDMKSVRGRIP
jgi:hypothetical protein